VPDVPCDRIRQISSDSEGIGNSIHSNKSDRNRREYLKGAYRAPFFPSWFVEETIRGQHYPQTWTGRMRQPYLVCTRSRTTKQPP